MAVWAEKKKREVRRGREEEEGKEKRGREGGEERKRGERKRRSRREKRKRGRSPHPRPVLPGRPAAGGRQPGVGRGLHGAADGAHAARLWRRGLGVPAGPGAGRHPQLWPPAPAERVAALLEPRHLQRVHAGAAGGAAARGQPAVPPARPGRGHRLVPPACAGAAVQANHPGRFRGEGREQHQAGVQRAAWAAGRLLVEEERGAAAGQRANPLRAQQHALHPAGHHQRQRLLHLRGEQCCEPERDLLPAQGPPLWTRGAARGPHLCHRRCGRRCLFLVPEKEEIECPLLAELAQPCPSLLLETAGSASCPLPASPGLSSEVFQLPEPAHSFLESTGLDYFCIVLLSLLLGRGMQLLPPSLQGL